MSNSELIITQFIEFIHKRLWAVIVIIALKDIAITFVKSMWLRFSMTLSDGGLFKIGNVEDRLITFSFFGIIL